MAWADVMATKKVFAVVTTAHPSSQCRGLIPCTIGGPHLGPPTMQGRSPLHDWGSHLGAPTVQGSTPIFQTVLSFSVSAILILFTYWPIHARIHSLARLGSTVHRFALRLSAVHGACHSCRAPICSVLIG